MKIKVNNDIITVSELQTVKEICKEFKAENFKFEAEIAANLVCNVCNFWHTETIYKIEAEIARNCRVYNQYSDNLRDLDIWLTIHAFYGNGFAIIGCYLTDIWQINGENQKEIAQHFYIHKFAEND